MFTAIGVYVCFNVLLMLIVHYSGLLLPPLTYMIDEVLYTDEEIKNETANFTPSQMSMVRKITFVGLTLIYWVVFCLIVYDYVTTKK